MSFNQYRTNPGQSVSNFKGRTDTPKAWPSTTVSQWLNGGLFGGGGADTWWSIYSFNSSETFAQGARAATPAGPWAITDKTSTLTADGSVVMYGHTNPNQDHLFYQISPSGVIAENHVVVGGYSIPNGQIHFGNFVTNGIDLMLCGGQTLYQPNSGNQLRCQVVAQPLSNTNTSGTPTIEDFKSFAFTNSWNQDRFKTIRVWHDDTAANNLLYWVQGGKPDGYQGWVFGTYNISTNAILCTGYAKMNNTDWNNSAEETNAIVRGDSGRMYGFGKGSQGRAGVYMSDGSVIGQSSFPQRVRNQCWQKTFTYTSGGEPSAAYSCGTYNGQDQVIAMFKTQQLYGSFETYFVKFTPYDGQVQATELVYANNNQGSVSPPQSGLQPGMVMDSNNNIYAIMKRNGLKAGEIVVIKLNYSLETQWIRCFQLSHGNDWNNNIGNSKVNLEPTGINLSADENFIIGHGSTEYWPDNGQYSKSVAFRIKTDGSGTQLNSADAHKLSGSNSLETSTIKGFNTYDLFLRYYDPADNSASPNPRFINVTALGGNWGSATSNASSQYYGSTNPASGQPTISPLANQANSYGNYAYENLFAG